MNNFIQKTLTALKETLSSSETGVLSTKRVIVAVASTSLIVCLLTLTAVCSFWIWKSGNVGSGASTSLLGVAGVVASLAGVAYRKPETSGDKNAS